MGRGKGGKSGEDEDGRRKKLSYYLYSFNRVRLLQYYFKDNARQRGRFKKVVTCRYIRTLASIKRHPPPLRLTNVRQQPSQQSEPHTDYNLVTVFQQVIMEVFRSSLPPCKYCSPSDTGFGQACCDSILCQFQCNQDSTDQYTLDTCIESAAQQECYAQRSDGENLKKDLRGRE